MRTKGQTSETTLLARYAARYAGSIRQRQSTVALRAARVEAELAYKARGTFLASMNHELRTPLNAITGFAGLLKEADTYGFATEQKEAYLDHILESADLLLSHINTILEVADAESGGTKMVRRVFALAEAIEETAETLKDELAERELRWLADLPDAVPEVDADPEKISVALSHICRFAVDEAAAGDTLTVTVREGLAGRSLGWVYAAVATSGQGRTAEAVADALRVFERVHEGLHRGFSRDDLALPIARSFVELNGGRFNVRTGANGALYRFALPIARAAEAASGAEDAGPEAVAGAA